MRNYIAYGCLVLLVGLTYPIAARSEINCRPLEPLPAANKSLEMEGKLRADLGGFASKIFGGRGEFEAAYKDVATNVLKEFPNADRLFVWQFSVYYFCEA